MNLKVRSLYFKVPDIDRAGSFYQSLFGLEMLKKGKGWGEIEFQNSKLAFILNDFGDKFSGSNCVPVIEMDKEAIKPIVTKAISLGGAIVFDGLEDNSTNSVVIKDPFENEFELTFIH